MASTPAMPSSSPFISPTPTTASSPASSSTTTAAAAAAASTTASPATVVVEQQASQASPQLSCSASDPTPIQKNTQKCWKCNKRVGLLGFKCKCDYVFCSNHRLSHAHQCIVDYQNLARGELETRLGEAIIPKKLERL
jgi:AN1-type zinc finger protein 5/6